MHVQTIFHFTVCTMTHIFVNAHFSFHCFPLILFYFERWFSFKNSQIFINYIESIGVFLSCNITINVVLARKRRLRLTTNAENVTHHKMHFTRKFGILIFITLWLKCEERMCNAVLCHTYTPFNFHIMSTGNYIIWFAMVFGFSVVLKIIHRIT